MVKPHLIITTAHINDDNRILEYIVSFEKVLNFKNSFETITIIETVSEEKLNYLENSQLDVYYSKLGNSHPNKGVNKINHVSNFLNNSKINDNEIVVLLTGRYLMVNTNILSLIETHMINNQYEMMSKDDGDVYGWDVGVHTFYFSFTKNKFLEFSNWYQTNAVHSECIEVWVKNYSLNHDKCLILPNNVIMGVETRLYQAPIGRDRLT